MCSHSDVSNYCLERRFIKGLSSQTTRTEDSFASVFHINLTEDCVVWLNTHKNCFLRLCYYFISLTFSKLVSEMSIQPIYKRVYFRIGSSSLCFRADKSALVQVFRVLNL